MRLLTALLFLTYCSSTGCDTEPAETGPDVSAPVPRVPTDPPDAPPAGQPPETTPLEFGASCEDDSNCASGLCLAPADASGVATCSRSCALDDDTWCNDVGMWCRPVDALGQTACDGALPHELGDDVQDGGTLLPGDARARQLDVGDADLYRLDYGVPEDGVQVSFRPHAGTLPQLTVYDALGAPVEDVRVARLGGIYTANFDPPDAYGWVVVENLGDDAAGYTVSLDHREPSR